MRFGNSSAYGVAPTYSTDLLPFEPLTGGVLLPGTATFINNPSGGTRFDVEEAKEIQIRVQAQGLSVSNEPSPWGSIVVSWHNRADLGDPAIVQDFIVLVQAPSSLFRPTLVGYEPECFQFNIAPLGRYFTVAWYNWCQLGSITSMNIQVASAGIRTSATDYAIMTPDQGQLPSVDPSTSVGIRSNPNQGLIGWAVWPNPAYPANTTALFLMPPMPGPSTLTYGGGSGNNVRFSAYVVGAGSATVSGILPPLWDTASLVGSSSGVLTDSGWYFRAPGLHMPAAPWILKIENTSNALADFRAALIADAS